MKQWLRLLAPIIKNSNISSQTLNGIYKQSNKRDSKSFKIKEPLASTKDGLLAIDDTGCPKPYAKNTEGAKWQYCGPLKREEACNVGICVAFVSKRKHFPLDIVPYLPADKFPGGKNNPHFKDKLHIAQELFDKSLEALEFSAVTFDSWYATTNLLEHIHTRKKIFFSEIKSNRNIFTLLDTVWAYLLEQAPLSYLTG